MFDPLLLHGLYSPWNSPGQNTGVGSLSLQGRSSQPRDRTQVSSIAGYSLPAEPQGKPKNTGVGSLSLLQWIFPTQESNRGLLHCRWILYHLSYQGSHKLLSYYLKKGEAIHPRLRYQANILYELTHIGGLLDRDYCPHFTNKEIEAEVA